jgi:Leucine-rich repeat (LRR) protein
MRRILLRRGNKIPMEGVTETKFGTETEETTIQRLSNLEIHSINNHQIQVLWQIPTKAC